MVEKISIKLPPDPRDEAFEEHVASYFLTSGYYVERRLVERELTDSGVEEILELDLIATDYRVTPPALTLVEAKSGDRWGFPDIFKIFGWMHYLKVPNGMFIVRQGHGNAGFYREKAEELSIKLLSVSGEYASQQEIGNIPEGIAGEMEHVVWRYSCWIERGLMRKLKVKKKSMKNRKCYAAMEDYYNKITSGIFFQENIIKRLEELYAVFQSHPRLTAKCANEELGNIFEEEYDAVPHNAFQSTWYECRYTDLHISTFIEHRARLAILKSAVDYTLCKAGGDDIRTNTTMRSNFNGQEFELSQLNALPSTFIDGLHTLSRNQYFDRKYSVNPIPSKTYCVHNITFLPIRQ